MRYPAIALSCLGVRAARCVAAQGVPVERGVTDWEVTGSHTHAWEWQALACLNIYKQMRVESNRVRKLHRQLGLVGFMSGFLPMCLLENARQSLATGSKKIYA
jgi:hypothetical protein